MSNGKKYNVVVSSAARDMLAEHLDFLRRVNKTAAKAKKAQIMRALRSLAEMPQRFPFLTDDYIARNKYRKMYIENWYLVLYQIIDDTVYVEYIIDCRTDNSHLPH